MGLLEGEAVASWSMGRNRRWDGALRPTRQSAGPRRIRSPSAAAQGVQPEQLGIAKPILRAAAQPGWTTLASAGHLRVHRNHDPFHRLASAVWEVDLWIDLLISLSFFRIPAI